MGNLLSHTFTSGLIMLAMYLIYKWALASENTHAYNRSVILFIYIISPVIAIAERYISFEYAPAVGNGIGTDGVTTIDLMELYLVNSGQELGASPIAPQLWPKIAIVVWLAGAAFFLARTLIGTCQLSKIIGNGESVKIGDNRLVIIDRKDITPFSTRRTIVVNRDDYESAGGLIIAHETAHIELGHWLDLVLAKVICIIGWFNPASWLLAEELKTVHEYQADMRVLKGGADARQYQMLLIKKAVGKSFPAIANSLNHSKLKKRITMMLKSDQKGNRRMRALALVPAAALALLVTNIPVIASGLSEVSQVNLTPTATSADKDSDKILNSAQATSNSKGGKDNKMSISMTTSPSQSNVIVMSSSDSSNYSMVINGEKIEGDFSSIPDGQIASVDVIKSDSDKSTTTKITKIKTDDTDVKVAAEVMPQFPGGDKALAQWVGEHLQFPAGVNIDDMPSRVMVVVRFVVDKNGHAVNPQIVRGADEPYNAEALRVIGEMPQWTPGTINGEPVNVNYTIPISFKKPTDKKATK